MKRLRAILGPNPELRTIAVLLIVIAIVLIMLLREARDINDRIPTGCGEFYNACEVHITS